MLAAFVTLCSSGCGFFEELQSADSVGTDTEGEDTDAAETGDLDTDTDAAACDFPHDDRCGNQDLIEHCDPDALTSELYDCSALCGTFVNFSCITTGTAQHGCYCVEAGNYKQYSCTELEDCLAGCFADGACEDQCFGRTTASTIRMLGSLVYCANDACHQTCIDAPNDCGTCIATTIAAGTGDCTLPRSICDSDINDDPNAPWG